MRARENASDTMQRKIAGRVMDLFRYWVKEVPVGMVRAGLGVFARAGNGGWGMARLLRGVMGSEVSQGRRQKLARRHQGAAIMDPLEAKVLLSAVISTDRTDYGFGSTAIISGSGFADRKSVV